MILRNLLLAALVSGAAGTAAAADLPLRKGAPAAPAPSAACLENDGVPSDAFGFTTGSDVADQGSLSVSGTYVGAFGLRYGSLDSHSGTLQASYGLVRCLEVGPYAFAGRTNTSLFGVGSDTTTYGGGVEIKYKLLGRDVHGIGLTIVVDPSGARNDVSNGGGNFNTYNTGLRIFADKTLIPGKLFAAANVSHDLTWNGTDPYARSSTLTLGVALSYQVVEGFFLSAEARHQRRYNDLGFGKEAGYATFVGPGFFWQANKSFALSGGYNVQVDGRAKGVPGKLDLTNFNQHVVKVKAAYSF